MLRFARLLRRLSHTTSTNQKIIELREYFGSTEGGDRNWALFILTGNGLKRSVSSKVLREWTAEITSLPLWLIEESYGVVGDLAETLALLNPHTSSGSRHSLSHWMSVVESLSTISLSDKRSIVLDAWQELGSEESWVFNKLITGGLRVGVAKSLVIRALSALSGVAPDIVNHRLAGRTSASEYVFEEIVEPETSSVRTSAPYPFFLAFPLDASPADLGSADQWYAEWKWDGIRAQLVKRADLVSVWSRGGELLTDGFPELVAASRDLPEDLVFDGELIARGTK